MESMGLNPAFWRGKRVFLTGHTGFKGSWLSLWLQFLGAELTGFALPSPTNPSLFEAANIGQAMHSVTGDICTLEALHRAMQECRPEIVIHMAAQPLVRESYEQPVETYTTNVMGTVHLLEAVRKADGVKAVVNVTTDKCYENRERIEGYREDEPMGGYDPYSNSKACSELVTSAYRSSFFNPKAFARHGVAIATARAGNVIGGGDWAKDRLIPDIVSAFLRGEPAMIRNPHAIRPWQHVLEPLRGYLVLAQRLFEDGMEFAEAWNFGPDANDAKPVQQIADYLTSAWGDGASWRLDDAPHPHEATYLKLDIAKAQSRLGWRPALALEAGIDLVVDWYREYSRGNDMKAFTVKQIRQYSGLVGATA